MPYTFRPVENPDNPLAAALHDFVVNAGEDDLTGTREDAQDLARAFGCKVELYDEQGFARGWVTADSYSLT